MTDRDPEDDVRHAAIDAAWRETVLPAVSQNETSVTVPEEGETGDPKAVSKRLSEDLDMEIDLNWEDAQYLTMMEAELKRLDRHGLLDGIPVVTDSPERFEHDLKDRASGLYNTGTGELYVAPEEIIGEEPRERQAKEGYFSTDKNFGSVWHELGHHWVRRTDYGISLETGDDEEYWGESEMIAFAHERYDVDTDRKALGRLADDIRSEVSTYAAEGGMEYVAEVFAGLMAGNDYPEWVMTLYERLGGYEPPAAARDPDTAYVPQVVRKGQITTTIEAAAQNGIEAAVVGEIPEGTAPAAREVAEGLQNLGAERVHAWTNDATGESAIDFELPLPGDDPIRSSATVKDGVVQKATLRFGVLDRDEFDKHPANDPEEIRAWADAVQDATKTPPTHVDANFGDDHYPPRPHVLVGWSFSGRPTEVVNVSDKDPIPVDEFLRYTEEMVDFARGHWDGKWADEEAQTVAQDSGNAVAGGRDWTDMDPDVLDAPEGWDWTISPKVAHRVWTLTEESEYVGWGPNPPIVLETLMGFFENQPMTDSINSWYFTRPPGVDLDAVNDASAEHTWWQIGSVFDTPDEDRRPGGTSLVYAKDHDTHPLRSKLHSQQYTTTGAMFTYEFDQWQGEPASGFIRIPVHRDKLEWAREKMADLPFEEYQMQSREYRSQFADGPTPTGTFMHPHYRPEGEVTEQDFVDLFEAAFEIMEESTKYEIENDIEAAVAQMTDLEVEIQNLTVGRGHSYRNFDVDHWHEILDKVDAHDDTAKEIELRKRVREALQFIEGGRFTPFLEALSSFFFRLDTDEMETFTRRNPEMVAWMSVYNRSEEMNPYQQYLDLAREVSDSDWNATDVPAFEEGEGDMAFRSRSYRNWAPGEFVEVAEEEGRKLPVHDYFERIEAGRFEEMVRLAYKFFIPLDMDERELFAHRNPGLTEWISVNAWLTNQRYGDELFHGSDESYPFVEGSGPRPDGLSVGKVKVPEQQNTAMQPQRAIDNAVHEAVRPKAEPDLNELPDAVKTHIVQWFEDHEDAYRRIWERLDEIRHLWSTLDGNERIAYLKASYIFAYFSIQTDLALAERAFERVMQGWKIESALQTEIRRYEDTPGLGPSKKKHIYRALRNDGAWERILSLIESGKIDAAHKHMIDEIPGLSAVKGGFTLAQLGFVQKMCIDGNVARLFGAEEQPDTDSVDTYKGVCQRVQELAPDELSDNLAPYELQWLLFDYQRQFRSQGGRAGKAQDDTRPYATHEEWFEIMLGDPKHVVEQMERVTRNAKNQPFSERPDYDAPFNPVSEVGQRVRGQIDNAIHEAVGQQINDREFGVIVPKYDNSGRRIKPEVLEDIAEKISERFGGVTVYPSVAGCWIPDEGPMAGELMCDENIYITTVRNSDDGVSFEDDADFLRTLGEDVAQDLGQFSVMVTEDRMEAEFIEGEYEETLDDDKLAHNVFQGLL